jgi:hypothetical protein
MKNILAENMLRFGPKNLSESDRRNLQKLMEQTEPNLGFAVGNEITIKNITVPGLSSTPGDLIIYVSLKGSSQYPPFTITNVIYKAPFTVVDAKTGTYKNAKGETIKSNSSAAAASVTLTISCGEYFSFNLTIKGGDSPSVSISNFKETNSGYYFMIGKDVVTKTNGPEMMKNILGKIYSTDSQNIAKSIFESQDWVKTAQKALPQA